VASGITLHDYSDRDDRYGFRVDYGRFGTFDLPHGRSRFERWRTTQLKDGRTFHSSCSQ
jgi:hypothetical protein